MQVTPKEEQSNQTVQFNALTIPTICSPIKNQAIEIACHNYHHLQGHKLADLGPESDIGSDVDILVGDDYYWHFLNGNIRQERKLAPRATSYINVWVRSFRPS